MDIYCCGCEKQVTANLTDGSVIYPHRPDLRNLPFWQCGKCGNYVGCHHKTKNRTRPLGVIPTPELRKARGRVHSIIDPLWQKQGMDRRKLYAEISEKLGWTYHAAKLRSVSEADEVCFIAKQIAGNC